jgi:hypothetical protein
MIPSTAPTTATEVVASWAISAAIAYPVFISLFKFYARIADKSIQLGMGRAPLTRLDVVQLSFYFVEMQERTLAP